MKARIYKAFVRFLNDIDLNKKLLIAFLLLIIFPLLLFTTIIYLKVSADSKDKFIYSASQALSQVSGFLEYKLDNTIGITDTIYYNSVIRDIITASEYNSTYIDDIQAQNEDARKISNLLSNLKQSQKVYRVRLYVKDGLTYSNEDVYMFNIGSVKKAGWYDRLMKSKEKVLCNSPEDFSNTDTSKVISIVRNIKDPNIYSRTLAIIRVDILESDIKNIIGPAGITKNCLVFLQNSDGEIVAANDNKLLENLGVNKNFLQADEVTQNSWHVSEINNKRYFSSFCTIRNTDWKLVSVIPYSEILSTGAQFRNYMLILTAVIILVAFCLAFIISRSSTKRINILVKAMEKVEAGDFNSHMEVQGRDEIGKLMGKFDYLRKRIAAMIEEQFETGKKMKSAELKALQSQINPHFLYNTLDMINWSAAINQIPEIGFIVQNLAKFYKLTLNKGQDIVRISDELEHVDVYLQIQNQRFENKINLVLNVNEELYGYGIVKTVLQPIVENSILHGLMEKDSKAGTIEISGQLLGTDIVLYVRDDGVGMTKDKIMAILQEGSTTESHGYGIKNINDRLKLYYGNQYGLTYSSRIGIGTDVEIRIPAFKLSNNDK